MQGGERIGGGCSNAVQVTRGWERGVDRAAEEMGVARLASAGLAGKHDGERTSGFRSLGIGGGGAVGEALQGGVDGGEVVEGVQAVGAGSELAGSLRAAKKQEAEDGGLVAAEVEDGAGAVLVLGDA